MAPGPAPKDAVKERRHQTTSPFLSYLTCNDAVSGIGQKFAVNSVTGFGPIPVTSTHFSCSTFSPQQFQLFGSQICFARARNEKRTVA